MTSDYRFFEKSSCSLTIIFLLFKWQEMFTECYVNDIINEIISMCFTKGWRQDYADNEKMDCIYTYYVNCT